MFLCMFQWGGNKSLLAVNSAETVIILNEQIMNAHYNHEVRHIRSGGRGTNLYIISAGYVVRVYGSKRYDILLF